MAISGAGKAISRARRHLEHRETRVVEKSGLPVATDARIVGADQLFVVVDGLRPCEVPALHDLSTGDLVNLALRIDEPPTPRTFVGYLDLAAAVEGLSADTERTYALVVHDPDEPTGAPRPVARSHERIRGPILSDVTVDLRWRFAVGGRPESLRVTASPVPPRAWIHAFSVDEQALVVTFAAGAGIPDGEENVVLEVVDDEGHVVADVPVSRLGDHLVVRIEAEHVAVPRGSSCRFRLLVSDHSFPLWRRHIDLQNPSRAAVMPVIETLDSEGRPGDQLLPAFLPRGRFCIRRVAPHLAEALE